MSQQDPFESPDRDAMPAKSGLSGCAIAAIGCGVVVMLLLIAAGIGAWWISQNARQIGTDMAVSAMKDGLLELDVPNDQRQRMDDRIDEIGKQFKEGTLDLKQVERIFQKISQGPLMPAGVTLFFKRVYIRDSGLDEAERATADIAIRRFSRGVIDRSIPEATRESILDRISTKNTKGHRQFDRKLTHDELRAFIDAVTKAADEAEVPADVPKIDFADEFDKAIDDALGQANVPAIVE